MTTVATRIYDTKEGGEDRPQSRPPVESMVADKLKDALIEFLQGDCEEFWRFKEALIQGSDWEVAVDFPIYWAPSGDGLFGEAVTDPLMLRVEINTAESASDPLARWHISLRDVLNDFYRDFSDKDETLPKVDPESSNVWKLSAIRDGLRELANSIDAAIARGRG